MNLYERQNRSKKAGRDWVRELKRGKACRVCGETHVACLDFHHLDPSTKFKPVSKMASEGYYRVRILEEIEKCEVLCRNCHAKLHYSHLD